MECYTYHKRYTVQFAKEESVYETSPHLSRNFVMNVDSTSIFPQTPQSPLSLHQKELKKIPAIA